MPNDTERHQVPAQIFLQTGPDQNSDDSGGGGSNLDLSVFFDYLDMIRNRLWLFITLPVLFIAAGFLYVYTATPIYQSTCQLQIQPKPLNISGFQTFNDPMTGTSDFAQHVNTEIELMQTPDVLNRAFSELNLDTDSAFATASPVGKLANNLTISQRRDTFLINVSYRSEDAGRAAQIANFLGDLYVRRYQERKHEVSGGGISRLREQLDKIAVARDQALKDLTGFKKEHQVMDLDYERELLSQRISALTETLIDAEMEERQAKEAADTIAAWKQEGHMGAIVQIADNQFAQTFRMEQLRMKMELPELLSKFGPNHSEVKTKQEIISNLEGAVEDEIDTSLVALHLKQQRGEQRREVIDNAIADLEDKLMALDAFGAEYYRLKDTYKAAEDAYRKVISRINDVNISVNTGEMEANDFLRVARRAVPNTNPIKPRRRTVLARAGFLGLFLGAGACILLGMMDASVKHKSDIERCMKNATILGSVPARPEEQSELVAAEDPHSLQAEAFRSIRTSLSLCLASRKERCFAVTSSGPGDGKTTVAINLAVALARDGKHVLLMECDMRRPRFSQIFEDSITQTAGDGVSKLLVGEVELQHAAVPFHKQEGLDILPCGPIPPNPGELLGTERFGDILKQAQEIYDYVIIDSPPLLNVADAAVLAGHEVPLLFVVRLFKTTRHDLRLAEERMQTIQAKRAGLILNQAEVPRHSRYGYHRHGHYSYYKHGDGYGYGYGDGNSNNGDGKEHGRAKKKQDPVETQG